MLNLISAKLPHSYSCVMIKFPDDLSNRLKSWCKKRVPDEDVFNEDSKGRENQIHCTVKYGLHTTSLDDITSVLDEFRAFDIELGKISRFTSPDDFDVLKIEVISNKLHQLHKRFNELPNSDEYDQYKPHTTLSYINKGSCYNLSGNDDFVGEKFKIRDIIFSTPDGNKTILQVD